MRLAIKVGISLFVLGLVLSHDVKLEGFIHYDSNPAKPNPNSQSYTGEIYFDLQESSKGKVNAVNVVMSAGMKDVKPDDIINEVTQVVLMEVNGSSRLTVYGNHDFTAKKKIWDKEDLKKLKALEDWEYTSDGNSHTYTKVDIIPLNGPGFVGVSKVKGPESVENSKLIIKNGKALLVVEGLEHSITQFEFPTDSKDTLTIKGGQVMVEATFVKDSTLLDGILNMLDTHNLHPQIKIENNRTIWSLIGKKKRKLK
jgi:hypothetical protein